MSDAIANRTLELACTVGSLENAIEALEDGADVNFRDGSPLFLAIVNRDRAIINFLLDHGVNGETMLPKKILKSIHSREDLVEELVACAPYNPRQIKIEELQEIFDYCGGTFKVISKTEHLGFERGIEISKWLKDNIKPETHGCHYFDFHKYAIIDDDSDMLLNQRFNFFQTDNYSGLTPNTCYKIKRFITGRTFGVSV